MADDLRKVLTAEMHSAVGYNSDNFQAKREKALDYYMGAAFGNEEDGRSQVVVTEVADSVDYAQASLMRVYTGQDVVTFAPQSADGVAAAEQATDYCKYIFEQQVGFGGLADLTKDALMYGMAAVKVVWTERERYEEASHEALSEMQLGALLQDDTVEVVEQTARVVAEIDVGAAQVDPMTGEMVPPPALYDVTLSRRLKDAGIEVTHIPPEQILISDDAPTVNDARLVAHRSNVTKSDLVSLGYDQEEIEDAMASSIAETQEEKARIQDLRARLTRDAADDAQELVEYVEAYLYYDEDEDGIAELHKVCALGDTCHILHHEVVDHCPIVLGTVISMPHRAIGRGMAELLFDVQEIKSTILRQHLDNLYAQNNARTVAVDGQVNLDDLLSATPGGVVRVRSPGAVQPLAVAPLQASAFSLLEYVDGIKEQRTGLSKASQGLALDKLQSTAAIGINATLSMAQSKMEMMARVFAETLLKPTYRLMYRLLRHHQDRPRVARLRGSQFVEVAPSRWPENFDTVVNVGMGGSANTQERMQFLAQVAQKQEQILTQLGPQNSTVTLAQYAETLRRMLLLGGIEDTTSLVNAPSQVMQAEMARAQQAAQAGPQPDKEMQKIQANAQIKQIEIEARAAQAEREAVQKAEADAAQAAQDMQIAQYKADLSAAAEQARMETQAQLDRERMAREFEFKMAELEAEKELEIMKMAAGSRDGQGDINMSD